MPGCQASIITLGIRVISFTSAGCPACCLLKTVSQFCCCDEMPWESARETRCSLAHSFELGSVSARKTPQGFRQLTPLHLSPRCSAEWPHACMLERHNAEWPHACMVVRNSAEGSHACTLECRSAEWPHACTLVCSSAEWSHACMLMYNNAEWSHACMLVHSSPCLRSSEPPS